MNLLGIRLKMLIGQERPATAPLEINEALQSVEVTHSEQGRSGFQLTFQIGRGLRDLRDYSLLKNPLIQPFNRVILVVIFNVTPRPLMDGIITNHQLSPGSDPGASTLTVTGEDISIMMDLEQKPGAYSGSSDDRIVDTILEQYRTRYGLRRDITSALPLIVNPPPNPRERTPTQPRHMTDLGYIDSLATRYGYVFYVRPGDAPGTNIAYWGPPRHPGEPQRALSVNMGPHTNVESMSFRYNALAPNSVTVVQGDNEQPPIEQSSRQPPLVRQPASPRRRVFLHGTGRVDSQQTQSRAQAMVDKSMDEVVSASGELDTLRYGGILESRKSVDLHGAGESYDGTYYVKSVTHKIDIRKGEYKQSFSLTREGLGALRPIVRV